MSKYAKPVIVGLIVAFVVGGGLGFLASAGGVDPGMTPGLVGMIFGAFTAYIMANLAGNRKSKPASDADKAAAVALTPRPGEALLIVYREGFVGMAAGMNVLLDGQPVAQLKSPRFTALSIAPGDHGLQLGFGGLAKAQNRDSEWRFTAAAGQIVAFRAAMAMGALKNSITVVRIETDQPAELEGLRARLGGMTMTAPDAV